MTTHIPFTPQQLTPSSISEEVILENRISVIHQVLSPSDCLYLIETLEGLGLELASTQINFRSNHRVRISSPVLSSHIFSKISKFLKPIRLSEDDYQQTGEGFKLHGLWEPSYITPHWVFSKYIPGTHFGPHYDGPTVINFGERSLQSLVIYLNDSFIGGTTNFFDESKQEVDPKDNNDFFIGNKDFIIQSISPEKGSALLFHHRLLHEGEILKEGYKYILRSDIVYKRTHFPDIKPSERDAIDWLIKAQQLEIDKYYKEATQYYKKAYRLWPELEFINSEL